MPVESPLRSKFWRNFLVVEHEYLREQSHRTHADVEFGPRLGASEGWKRVAVSDHRAKEVKLMDKITSPRASVKRFLRIAQGSADFCA